MKMIQLIKGPDAVSTTAFDGDKAMNELFNGPFRRIVEVRLQNSAVLSRHHAAEPITVLCLSGTGTFTAGPDLEDSQILGPGTMVTLEAGIDHEVTADPDLHLIVSKFKDS